MKRAAVATVFVGAFCLWSNGLPANPISIDGSAAVQVPKTFHVQVSYYADSNYGKLNWPIGLKKNGVEMTVTWIGPTGVTVNSGSGLSTYDAMQVCDCHLKAGFYEYEFMYKPGGDIPWSGTKVSLTVVDPPPEAKPQPADVQITEETMPWDIPAPPWPKGADCVEWCKQHTPEPVPEAVTPETTAPETTTPEAVTPEVVKESPALGETDDIAKDSGGTPSVEEDKGKSCAMGFVGGQGSGLAMLLIMAAGVLRRRW